MNKSTKVFFAIAYVLTLSLFIFLLHERYFAKDGRIYGDRNITMCIKEKCFKLDVAHSEAEREKGLQNIKFLPKDRGMLFVFDKSGVYPFWMKNTFIDLDIIWMDDDFKAVSLKKDAKPCSSENCPIIDPRVSASYVLEINSKVLDISIGDIATIKQ